MVAIHNGLIFAGEVLADLPAMKVLFLPAAGAMQPQYGAVSDFAGDYGLLIRIALFAGLPFNRF